MKKTNLVLTTLLFSAVTVGGTIVASAAESDSTSTAVFRFMENDDAVGPVNPENPSEEENPENPVVHEPNPENPKNPNRPTDNNGPLSIDVVPGKMNFGNQKISLAEQTYTSIAEKGSLHYLQITDGRSIDQEGWNLTVSRTAFVDGNKTLDAGLFLPAARTVRNALEADPTAAAKGFVTSLEKFEIPVGAAQAATLLGTGTAEGKGTSTYTWSAEQEELVVGAKAAKGGNFLSTITWSLNAGPSK